jgi:glycosyltransferase involved in cell wall biosynthesis
VAIVKGKMQGKGLSVIIPAYNEEKRISAMLEDYGRFYPAAELIVVINNTTDRTEDVVAAFERRHRNVRHIVFPQRIGKGGAVIEGFKIAKGALIGFSDADNSTPPQEFDKLVQALGNDTALAGAIGSRRLPASVVPQAQPLSRRVAARIFNLIVRTVFAIPFRDTQCGAKLFRREPLLKVLPRLRIRDFAFDIETLYEFHHSKMRVAEVPIVWYDKAGSKVRLVRTSWSMFKSVMLLRLIHSPLRFLFAG